MDNLIITIFCEIDNFCKEFIPYWEQQCLPMDDNPINLELPSVLTLSEAMTICVVFHHSGYRTFKKYYQDLISQRYRKFFPRLVSYNRFVELMPDTALPLAYFVCSHKGSCTGISFVDSTTLDVCDTHRIPQHKVFQEIAQRGKSSTGQGGIGWQLCYHVAKRHSLFEAAKCCHSAKRNSPFGATNGFMDLNSILSSMIKEKFSVSV